jgi:hypothetical protein
MSDNWPFTDPPNVPALTTVHVLDGRLPIRLVTHDEDDGTWQVLCGTTDEPADSRLVEFEKLYAQDPSIGQLADLPLGWKAWRESPDSPWVRAVNGNEEE